MSKTFRKLSFRTSRNEVVSGDRLVAALGAVADDWANLARAIRAEDAYAEHVTEAVKEAELQDMLAQADSIRTGIEPLSFTIWQRINEKLIGESVPLLA